MAKRICIDIDGVICELKKPTESYDNLTPKLGAVDAINKLRSQGNYIILYTARHMKTTQSNQGLVTARVGAITLQWLERYGVEYDEIYFGKPWADIYIDDNAFRFTSWKDIGDSGEFLPPSTESVLK